WPLRAAQGPIACRSDAAAGGRDDRARAAGAAAELQAPHGLVPESSAGSGCTRLALAGAGNGRAPITGAGARPPYEAPAEAHARPTGVPERLRHPRDQSRTPGRPVSA